jgi:hypothetical protein
MTRLLFIIFKKWEMMIVSKIKFTIIFVVRIDFLFSSFSYLLGI